VSRAARRTGAADQPRAAAPNAPNAGRRPARGKRRDELSARTIKDYTRRNRRWDADCATRGTNPDEPDPLGFADYLRRQDVKASTKQGLLDAHSRRHYDAGTEIPGMHRPALKHIRALERAERKGHAPARPPAPKPRPMTAADIKAAKHAPPAGDRTHVAKGQAALLALWDGHALIDMAHARTPDATTHANGTPLTLDTARPRAKNSTVTLSAHTPDPRLPSPVHAALRLAALLPPATPHLLAHTALHHDRRPAPPGTETRHSIAKQLNTAANNTDVNWPGHQRVHELNADDVLAVYEALDPDFMPRLRDHAQHTIGYQHGPRADNLFKFDIAHAERSTTDADDDATWTLTLISSKGKNKDGRQLTLRRDPDPDLDPVDALDRLVDALRRHGHTRGPLLPATNRHGIISGRQTAVLTANRRLAKNNPTPQPGRPLTTRSYRKGAATHLANSGHTLNHIANTLGNNDHNTHWYTETKRPYVLRL
jgi:hypothetical protein